MKYFVINNKKYKKVYIGIACVGCVFDSKSKGCIARNIGNVPDCVGGYIFREVKDEK